MAGLGAAIAANTSYGGVFYLQGTLGMGKTTLARSIIQGAGWSAHVKSPTYTLVESYPINTGFAYHFDLYRLSDPEELEFMGIRDYDMEQAIWLIEWPERGVGVLPVADVVIDLFDNEQAREVSFTPQTKKGEQIVSGLAQWQAQT